MKIEELNDKESSLIEIIRTFHFLHSVSYHEKEITIEGRGNPSMVYHNWIANRTIYIIGDESSSWSIVVQRKKLFCFRKSSIIFDISDYFDYFDLPKNKQLNCSLKTQAEFIQKNLMPVIRGEMWIDELIKNV